MNSKLIKASVAGAAAIALAAGGGTWAAWNDTGFINGNSEGAGILKLNLTSGSGTVAAPLTFAKLSPGGQSQQAIYVASSDGASVPAADLYLTLNNLKDFENGCGSSQSELAVDSDCATADATSTDTTSVGDALRAADDGTKGDLSKILDMRIVSYAAPSALACKGWVGGSGDPGPVINNVVIPNHLGNMRDPALANPILISDPSNPLTHGQGVCLTFTSWWPKTHTAAESSTPDNAAQSDSFTFDAGFNLSQH